MKTREELIEQYPYLIKALQTFGYETTEQFWSFVESYASQFKSNWIDVKERLPEKNQGVLCWVIGRLVHPHHQTATYFKDGVFPLSNRNTNTEKVTHWMPLPQAPAN
jgi:hypothetical protein